MPMERPSVDPVGPKIGARDEGALGPSTPETDASDGDKKTPNSSGARSTKKKSARRESSGDADAPPSTPATSPGLATRSFGVDREALKKQFKKPTDLFAHGRYLPNQTDGVRRGLRFVAIAPGGIFGRLGFQNGDVVLSVNGAPLNTQQDILANFKKMRRMKVLNIRLERDGEPRIHRYILK